MKRKILFLLLLISAAFSFSACGGKDSASKVSSEQFNSEAENAPAKSETTILSTETISETTEISDTENSGSKNTAGNYTITYESITEPVYAETDDTVQLIAMNYEYPVVSSDTHGDAAAVINSAIQEEVETFKKSMEETKSYAMDDYSLSEDGDYTFNPYSLDMTSQTMRNDENLLSFVINESSYTGGAHGNSVSFGLTFNAKTGEKLTLDTLSDDSTAFRGTIQGILNQQVSGGAYNNYIFEDFAPDVETALLGESNVWYFDNGGMSFISNPYELGSYAAGTFYFYIPYRQLTGLKADYAYTGNFEQNVFPGISSQYDLNGDGSEDTICYSASYNDNYDMVLSLSINDVDFSDTINDLKMDVPDTDRYMLTDLDPTDDYVELAVFDDAYNTTPCTYFFRYEQDGTLSSLGKVDSIITAGNQVELVNDEVTLLVN